MSGEIADLMAQLQSDPWRQAKGFSADFLPTQQALFAKSLSDEDSIKALGAWIQKSQPCLFGKIADRLGLIHYCILRDADLASDDATKIKIQKSRLEWTRAGFLGQKSGFVILAISEKLATSLPDDIMKRIAIRICTLYLETEIQADFVHTDELFLEIPDDKKTTWKWLSGVNYFSATGDGRWWQDHRIPGGMGFSTNSIGHLVKSGKFINLMQAMKEELGIAEENVMPLKVDSLDMALELAMRTIANASNAVSGKATMLCPMPPSSDSLAVSKCPIELPPTLADKNYCEYEGYYHTDETIPSEYFNPAIARPEGTAKRRLDFTYLFQNKIDNPAFTTMGTGKRLRTPTAILPAELRAQARERRGAEQRISIESAPLLKKALGL